MNMPIGQLFPKNLAPWIDLFGLLGSAAERAARDVSRAAFRSKDRRGHGQAPEAGALVNATSEATASTTPMWDVLSLELDKALGAPGARARLARYLGVPRQRITDFTKGRRVPDGEITLRLLHWLAVSQAGQDPSFIVAPVSVPGSEATR